MASGPGELRLPSSGSLFLIAEAQRYMGNVADLIDELVRRDMLIAELQERIKLLEPPPE